MKFLQSQWGLGLVLAVLFVGFYAWQTPSLWQPPLTAEEIDGYMAQIEQHLEQPEPGKSAFIARVREWAAGDDGEPVLMLNLMRYRPELGPLPPELHFEGSPHEANAYYERIVTPLALKQGEYPLVGGDAQARSLTMVDTENERWERAVVMRAPSRRAFIAFMTDPAYGPAVPYKLASMEVMLIPVDAEISVPDLRWVVGGLLLVIFLAAGWRRSATGMRPYGA